MSCMYNFLPIRLVLVGAIRLVFSAGGDAGPLTDKDVVGDLKGTTGMDFGGGVGGVLPTGPLACGD